MPKAFDNCRKKGGKIRTKQLGGGKYVHICTIGGQSFRGYVKNKSLKKGGGSPVAAAIKERAGK